LQYARGTESLAIHPNRNSLIESGAVQIATPFWQVVPLNKQTILLADDHPSLPKIVAGLLEAAFEVVGQVGDGQALIEAAGELKPDVIITDISMPVRSGLEAANILKQAGCTSKIIFLTVHTDPDFIRACLDTGALGYVAKSHMATDLSRAIREVLAERVFVSPSLRY